MDNSNSVRLNLQIALRLAAAGYPIFPAELKGGQKKPCIAHWQNKATTNPKVIKAWWQTFNHAFPALPTGPQSGLAVVDLDVKGGKDGLAALRARGINLGGLGATEVATPSGGRHFYFRWREGVRNSTSSIASGVDVRGAGGFVVAPGAVTPGGTYEPLGDDLAAPLVGLTNFPAWALPPPREEREAAPPPDVPFDTVRDALMAIPNDESNPHAKSRDWWLGLLAAVHHATGGSDEGRNLAHEWSRQWPDYSEAHTDQTWNSFRADRPGARTVASLLAEARRHRWRDLSAFDDAQDDDAESDEEFLGRMVGNPAEAGQVKDHRKGLTFETPDVCADLALTAGRRPVIKGLLAAGDVGAIIGAPGAGKSLLGPRLAYAVAQGESAFGLKVGEGPVLYVAAEDRSGMRGRIAALRGQHGEAPDLRLVGGVSSLFPESPDLKALRVAVKDMRPVLILIDTLAMAFPGLKENEADHMGLVVAAARHLTKWGAAVLLIHHDTKGRDGLPRGHSILNSALDVSLHLTRDGRTVTARPTKNRNGPPDLALAFSIETVDLGTDGDGDRITAAYADEITGGAAGLRGPKLSPSARAVHEVLRRHGGPKGELAEDRLRKLCVDGRAVSASEHEKNRRDTFRRAAAEMVRKGFAVFANGFYRLPSPQPDPVPVAWDRNEPEFSEVDAMI